MARKYTGYDGDATGKQAGLEELVRQLCTKFPLWNNGTWVVRNMKNANLKTAKPSVHSTGRAADISWRKSGKKGSGNYADAVALMDFLVLHADALQIESVHDYFPQPHGRGWKCDRGTWTVYDKPTIGSAPGGDWIHLEISPPSRQERPVLQGVLCQPRDGIGRKSFSANSRCWRTCHRTCPFSVCVSWETIEDRFQRGRCEARTGSRWRCDYRWRFWSED